MRKIKSKWKRFRSKPEKYFGDFQFYSKKVLHDFYNLFQENKINKKIILLQKKYKNQREYYIKELLKLYEKYPKVLNLNLELAKSYEHLGNTKEAIQYFEYYLAGNPYNVKIFMHYLGYISSMTTYTNLKSHLFNQLQLKKKDLDYINKIGSKFSTCKYTNDIIDDIIPLLTISTKYINVVLANFYSGAMNVKKAIYYWEKVDSKKYLILKKNILQAYQIKPFKSLFNLKDEMVYEPRERKILIIIEKDTDLDYLIDQSKDAKKIIIVCMNSNTYRNIDSKAINDKYSHVSIVSDLIDFSFEYAVEHEDCVYEAQKYASLYIDEMFRQLEPFNLPEYIKINKLHWKLYLEDRFYKALIPVYGLKKVFEKYCYDEIVLSFNSMSFEFSHLIFEKMNKNTNLAIWFNVISPSIIVLNDYSNYLKRSFSRDMKVVEIKFTDELEELFCINGSKIYKKYEHLDKYIHMCVQFINPSSNYLYYPTGFALLNQFAKKHDVLFSQINWINNKKVKKEIEQVVAKTYDQGYLKEMYVPSFHQYEKYIKKYRKQLNKLNFLVLKAISTKYELDQPENFLMLSNISKRFSVQIFSNSIRYLIDINKLYETNPPIFVFNTVERAYLSRIAVTLAQYHGIKTFGNHPVVISTSPRYKKPLVDYHFVIDKEQKRMFYEHFGYEEKRLIIAGSATIDDKFERYNKADAQTYKDSLNLNNCEKIVMFATQHSQGEHQFKIVKYVLESLKGMNNVGLIIKPHPIEPQENLYKYEEMIKNYGLESRCKVETDNITYELMKMSDLLITLFSTVGLEAAMFGKKVLVINLKKEPLVVEWDKVGIANGAHSAEDISNEIYKLLYDKEAMVLLERKQREYFGPDLGKRKFTDIVSEHIENILKDKNE